MIVEGHAWADDIQNCCPFVAERRLEQLTYLGRIPGKRPRHERGIRRQRFQADVDRGQLVYARILQLLPIVCRSRELAFGKAVHAVVLDNINHRDIAPNHVLEVAQADATGIAVAADADRDQLVIDRGRAGSNGRHSPVQ